MYRFLFLFPVMMGLMHPTDASVSEAVTLNRGSRIRYQIEKSFKLKHRTSKRELYAIVQRSINEANPKHQGLSIPQINSLSREVVQVSECFGIDPVIYTSLIWRESNFKPSAISERGATGLTQMTIPAIQEVLERVSPTSHRRLGYLRSLVQQCSPNFLARVPGQVSADTLIAWKTSVAVSHRDALVMGAILLKLELANTNPELAKGDHLAAYREALQLYNGDPQVKVQFAQDVLMLSKRMVELPEVAINDSKFLSQIEGF